MRTTSAPSNPDGRGLEPNGPEDTVGPVPGPFTLVDRHGCDVLFRPLVQTDRPTVARLFPGLSAQTRFRRFNSLYGKLSNKQLISLFDLDYRDRFAWAVEIACDGVTVPVAVGRYARYPGSRRVDVGITIRDQWHGRGMGGSLLDTLIITAHHHGFVAFETVVTADNQPMLHLLRQRGAELSLPTSGEVDVVLPLPGIIGQLSDHPLSRMLTTAGTARASSRESGGGEPGYSVLIAVATPPSGAKLTSGPLPQSPLPFVEPSHASSGRVRSETLTERSA